MKKTVNNIQTHQSIKDNTWRGTLSLTKPVPLRPMAVSGIVIFWHALQRVLKHIEFMKKQSGSLSYKLLSSLVLLVHIPCGVCMCWE